MASPEEHVELRVRRLEPGDERGSFSSGNVDLDRFFLKYAGQNQFRHHIGTTYVAVDAAERIAGFATVTASEIAPETMAQTKTKRLPRYPVPVLRLARLAVDERVRGHGVGGLLLRAVFVLAQQMADEIGCLGVLVDAKPDAVAFYAKLGFTALESVAGELGDRPQTLAMFLELGQIPRAK
jgi:GNAT superfamily N-acetyltransferase